jgi:hypothetical protein
MKVYRFQAMDNLGNEEHGFLNAESQETVQTSLAARGLFVTGIDRFAPDRTPEWSATCLVSPDRIPSERFLSEGYACRHEHRRMRARGLLNVLGRHGALHLVLDSKDGLNTEVELPVQDISQVQQQGLFRKRLVVKTSTHEEHVFRGSLNELRCLCEWAIFVTRKNAAE